MDCYGRKIGFSSQKIRYEWVERVAWLCMAGLDTNGIKKETLSMLASTLSDSGRSGRTSRSRACGILKKIWITPAPELVALRDSGFSLLQKFPKDLHRVIHWGMVMASYPFWADVASEAGRLLRLQESFTVSQVRRRLKERYGDRETVKRATQTVLRSFVDWRVLKETGENGRYSRGERITVEDPRLVSWLVEAWLHANNNGIADMQTILNAPSLFPFKLAQIPAYVIIKNSKRLELFHLGLEERLVGVRRV